MDYGVEYMTRISLISAFAGWMAETEWICDVMESDMECVVMILVKVLQRNLLRRPTLMWFTVGFLMAWFCVCLAWMKGMLVMAFIHVMCCVT